MSAREFSKVSPALWRSARFAGLSDKGKIAFFYFCTNAHITSAGCYILPDGYACSDLGCALDEYQSARDECAAAGLIDFDGPTVFVERWFRHNPPMNDSHATGTKRFISEIESDRLREKVEAEFTIVDQQRMEREAAHAAAKAAAKARRETETLIRAGTSDRLTGSNFMRGLR